MGICSLWSMLLAPTTEGWSKSVLPATFSFYFFFLFCFYLNLKEIFLQCCISFCHEGVLVFQLHPTLFDIMNHSPPGSSVHGILQARILEWLAMPFSKTSSRPARFPSYDSANQSQLYMHLLLPSFPSLHPIHLSHHSASDWAPCATQQLLTTHPSHTWECVYVDAVFFICPTLSFPHCVHKAIPYGWVSIPSLQIGSSISFF